MKLKTEESVLKMVWFVIGFVVLLVGSGLLACYPHTCLPSDTSCFGCNDPRTTNPACHSFPSDTKAVDAGAAIK